MTYENYEIIDTFADDSVLKKNEDDEYIRVMKGGEVIELRLSKDSPHYALMAQGTEIWNLWSRLDSFEEILIDKTKKPDGMNNISFAKTFVDKIAKSQFNSLKKTYTDFEGEQKSYYEIILVSVDSLINHFERAFVFPNPRETIQFSNIFWQEDLNFTGYDFSMPLDISYSIFGGNFVCKSINFMNTAYFDGCIFNSRAVFDGSTFHEQSGFMYSSFIDQANYSEVSFCSNTNFSHSIFYNTVYFEKTKFSYAVFENTVFKNNVSFAETKINAPFVFDKNSEFHCIPIFSGVSGNGVLDIEKANFSKMYDAIDGANAETFSTDLLYLCQLKREMEDRKQHDAALTFFANELKCRAKASKNPFYQSMIWTYEGTSNFGRSALIPFILLMELTLAMSGVYQGGFIITQESFAHSLQYSIPFNIGETIKYEAPFLHAFQRITSTVLLFLIGLGIRNKLRIG